MKGTSHFHSLTSEDNLALKNARKINKIVSEVRPVRSIQPSLNTFVCLDLFRAQEKNNVNIQIAFCLSNSQSQVNVCMCV